MAGEFFAAVIRLALEAGDVFTSGSSVDLVGTGSGTGVDNICILNMSATAGSDCTATITCDTTSNDYTIGNCVADGNNTFNDPTVGDFAIYYTSDVDGVQFPGDPAIYVSGVNNGNEFSIVNCEDTYATGGLSVTDCDGNDYTANVCNGGYGTAGSSRDDSYVYYIALPYSGHTLGC